MFIVYTRDGKERCVLKEIECIGKYMNERVVTDSLVRAVKDGRIEIEQVPKELVKEVKNRLNG